MPERRESLLALQRINAPFGSAESFPRSAACRGGAPGPPLGPADPAASRALMAAARARLDDRGSARSSTRLCGPASPPCPHPGDRGRGTPPPPSTAEGLARRDQELAEEFEEPGQVAGGDRLGRQDRLARPRATAPGVQRRDTRAASAEGPDEAARGRQATEEERANRPRRGPRAVEPAVSRPRRSRRRRPARGVRAGSPPGPRRAGDRPSARAARRDRAAVRGAGGTTRPRPRCDHARPGARSP